MMKRAIRKIQWSMHIFAGLICFLAAVAIPAGRFLFFEESLLLTSLCWIGAGVFIVLGLLLLIKHICLSQFSNTRAFGPALYDDE